MKKKMIMALTLSGLMVLSVLLTGCAKGNEVIASGTESEGEVITLHEPITVDGLRAEYMGDIGWEYEDELIADFSERYDGNVIIYNSNELSLEMLENRNGDVIIERCYGVVTDGENGVGKVLYPYDEDYDYISYFRCKGFGIREGTLIMTYLIYNPDSNYCDDIIDRFDCLVSRELED